MSVSMAFLLYLIRQYSKSPCNLSKSYQIVINLPFKSFLTVSDQASYGITMDNILMCTSDDYKQTYPYLQIKIISEKIGHCQFEPTNQESICVTKVFKPINELVYRILAIINLMQIPFWFYIIVIYKNSHCCFYFTKSAEIQKHCLNSFLFRFEIYLFPLLIPMGF